MRAEERAGSNGAVSNGQNMAWATAAGAQRCQPEGDKLLGPVGFTDLLGAALGLALAPLVAAGSALRGARLFHPEGVIYSGQATALATLEPLRSLAQGLAGPVLVRFSAALWRHGREWPDVLGAALRFQAEPGATPTALDQDLLLATIPRAVLTPLAPLWTNPHDFLGNRYYGASPFSLRGVPGRAFLRLRPLDPEELPRQRVTTPLRIVPVAGRARRLALAVEDGAAALDLEVSLGSGYLPLVRVFLRRPLQQSQRADTMRFSPFRSGRGIFPRGLVQNLRRATYALSQAARPC